MRQAREAPAIDDGKCEWKFFIPTNAKTGTAKYSITVSHEGGSNTKEDEFKVRKGDVIESGDVSLGLELKDSPDDVTVGESFKVEIETDVGNKGTCDATATWPKSFGSLPGESKKPDGGKCSWTFVAPTTITKSGKATLTVWVKNSKGASRYATKEFDVKTK